MLISADSQIGTIGLVTHFYCRTFHSISQLQTSQYFVRIKLGPGQLTEVVRRYVSLMPATGCGHNDTPHPHRRCHFQYTPTWSYMGS